MSSGEAKEFGLVDDILLKQPSLGGNPDEDDDD
jgi:hypothetical protein